MPPKFQIDPSVVRGVGRQAPAVAAPASASELISTLEGFAARTTARLQEKAVIAGTRLGTIEQERSPDELVKQDAGGFLGLDNPAFEAFNEAARATHAIQLRTDFIEEAQRLAATHRMDPERLRTELNHVSTRMLESARQADPSGALATELVPKLADIATRAYSNVLGDKLQRDWEAVNANWEQGVRFQEDSDQNDLLRFPTEDFVGKVRQYVQSLARDLDVGVALGRISQDERNKRVESKYDEYMEQALRGTVITKYLPRAPFGTGAWREQADAMIGEIITPMMAKAAFIRDEGHRLRLAKEFEAMLRGTEERGRAGAELSLAQLKSRVGRIMTAVHQTGGTRPLLAELQELTDMLQVLDDDPGKWQATFRGANLIHILQSSIPGTSINAIQRARDDLPALVTRLDLVSESTNALVSLYDRREQDLIRAQTAIDPMAEAATITGVDDPFDASDRAIEIVAQQSDIRDLSPTAQGLRIRDQTVKLRADTILEQRRLLAQSLGRSPDSIRPISTELAAHDLSVFTGFAEQGDFDQALLYAQTMVSTVQQIDSVGWRDHMRAYDQGGKQWGSILTIATLIAEQQPVLARALIEAQVRGPRLTPPIEISKNTFISDLKSDATSSGGFAKLRALDFSAQAQEIAGDVLWNLFKLESSRTAEFDSSIGDAAVKRFLAAVPAPDILGDTLPVYLPAEIRGSGVIMPLVRGLSTIRGLQFRGVPWGDYHVNGSPEAVLNSSQWEVVVPRGSAKRVLRLRYRDGRSNPWLADENGEFIEVDLSDVAPAASRSDADEADRAFLELLEPQSLIGVDAQ